MGGVPVPDDESELDELWVRAVPDGIALVVPGDERELLVAALRRGGSHFPDDVTIQVEDGAGPRDLTRDEIGAFIDEASAVCSAALDRTPPVIDEEVAGRLARSAAVLATIWSMALQAADHEPSAADVRWVGALGRLAADCEEMFITRIRPRPDGTYSLRWGAFDRRVVRHAIEELRGLIAGDDASIARLYPSAYGDDEERNAGWDVFVRGELIERRNATMDVAERLLGSRRCSEDDLASLMRCLNDARLVIGTRLDVNEVGLPAVAGREQMADAVAYERLSHLVAMTVEALEHTL